MGLSSWELHPFSQPEVKGRRVKAILEKIFGGPEIVAPISIEKPRSFKFNKANLPPRSRRRPAVIRGD